MKVPLTLGPAPGTAGMYRPLGTGHDPISVIMKLRGETCDVDCLYCFEKRKEAPGAARLSPADAGRMFSLFSGRPVAVELHGGEPLTSGRANVAALLDQLATQPNVIRVSMQTNGVRLDDDWLDLFDVHYPGLEIGISLDGDAWGNSWRVGYDGQPIYDKVVAALRLLADRGRQVGIIAVVTPRVLGRAAEVLDHLAGFAAVRAINFAPCFDAAVTRPTAAGAGRPPASAELRRAAVDPCRGPAWATTPAEYADFILAVAAHWIGTGLFRRLTVEPVVSAIRRLQGQESGSCHFSDRKCDHVFTLYPGGRLGSCDELPWPPAQLGALDQLTGEAGVVAAQGQSPLLADGKALMAKCLRCTYRTVCGGGCVASRWREIQAVGSDSAYCDYRMRLVDGVAALLATPQHPGAAHCRQVRWRPRHPNTMGDVAAFLRRWDDPTAARPPARVRTSGYGNINAAGLPGVHEADDLDPRHPQWQAGIEPAVWPLVDAFTSRWKCVTYDSCEGHRFPGTNLAPRPLSVGILPRDRTEAARLADRLCRLVTATAGTLPAPCRAVVGRSELTCRTTGRAWPTLDLQLEPVPNRGGDVPWVDYLAFRDQAVAAVVWALAEIDAVDAADSNPGCSCAAGSEAGT